jgi:hypothetical protein
MTTIRKASLPVGGFAMLLIVSLVSACASRQAPPPPALPPTATPTPVPQPPPAAIVPDQPFTGQLPAVEKPYLEIIRLRESGQSNDALLEKVRAEHVRYSLSTFEIQKLRAAGVSEAVIEAMLAGGRADRTPTPRGS